VAEDLNTRLRKGPLAVGTLFSPERAAGVSLRALRQRRKRVVRAALALSAVLLVVFALRLRDDVPSQQASDKAAPASVRLADGSTVELHGASSTLLTEHIAAQRVSLRLSGGARFDVVPNPARTFEVVREDVTVRVLGTAFSLEPAGERTRVAVERGRVEVRWAKHSALLTAGEVGIFPPIDAIPSRAAPEPRVAHEHAASPTPKSTREEPRARPVASHRSATELMLAADVARLSAQPEAAIVALEELQRRFPSDRRAPVAAFTLGRVLLDELGRSAEAATAFERACTLWPTGPLAEKALARAVEANERAKSVARARSLAEQYLRRYPQGSHAPAMRSLLQP
jgi:transmembrane sensor